MLLEAQVRDQGAQPQLELSQPQRAGASSRKAIGNERTSADAGKDFVRARAPTPEEPPGGERPIVELLRESEDQHLELDRKSKDTPRSGPLRQHRFAFAVGLPLFILAAAGGYLYWDSARHFETTDDAFIAARQFAIAPKVPGYITRVPVTDNQHVPAGGVIARIDERDYRIALAQALAQVASAEANIQNIDAQISVQQAQISANQAQVDQSQAALVFAQQQAARYRWLDQKDSGRTMDEQQWASQQRQQEAALEAAKANLTLAQRQIESLKAQRDSAVASLAQAKAQRDQAQLNLSYTTVTADQAGHVTNLTAAIGQFAQPGTNLTMFVPDEIWVAANFKENQLDAMRPGQPVTLEADAYPERAIHGHVDSVQLGSGTAFSLLPVQNATGNYVKIVQRVPVKIIMDNPPADVALGPGMSVVPSVRVDPTPSLSERLGGWLALFFEQLRGWL
jgi:membrane fusion protein (multidrug efflux system)